MTFATFFTDININFLVEVLGLGIAAWAAGYGAGYVIHITRKVANQST